MIKVLFLFGTRPEAIKMIPVIIEMSKFPKDFKVVSCVTGQHREMLDQVLKLFNLKPDIDLNLMEKNQGLPSLTARALKAVSQVLNKIEPDIVLVQGDTTTAMISALASFYQKIPVAHVEAGLRTTDIYNPFPEEINRRLISVLSTLNFAPTKIAGAFLKKEGIENKKIFITGNTVVDALRMIVKKNSKSNIHLNRKNCKLILVTAHRRENFGKPLQNICAAIKEIAKKNSDVEIIYPVHLNPNVKDIVYKLLKNQNRITLIPPVTYSDLVYLMRKSYIVLTDSGGIQEEAPTFGKPVLVMRKTTERPEGVKSGVAKVVGTETERIVKEVCVLLNDRKAYEKMSKSINPYGDGKASKRICRIIKNYFTNRD